jgi:hypothetical protein
MDTNEIKILIDKFYEGETTLEEEKLLQKYFAENGNNTESFAAEKYLFANINYADNVEIISDLTQKIIAKIDDADKKQTRKFLPAISLRLISAAACIIILIAVIATVSNIEEPKFVANINTNEAEILEMLEDSFSKISTVVDDAVAMLDITGEQVCELNEELSNL